MQWRNVFGRRAASDPSIELPPLPEPFTSAHPACLEVERRLTIARMKMVARGVKLLMVDRPAWDRVTGGAKVIPMNRGR